MRASDFWTFARGRLKVEGMRSIMGEALRRARVAACALAVVVAVALSPGRSMAADEAAGWAEAALRKAGALEARGDFRKAALTLASAMEAQGISDGERRELQFERARLDRIRRDYGLTRAELWERLKAAAPDVTVEEFDSWDREGRFDAREIDGERRYFNSSVSNLFFRHPELEARRVKPRARPEVQTAYWRDAMAIREAALKQGTPHVLEKTFRVRMRVRVKPGAVAAGGVIRAWLPVPRRFPHQDGFVLEGTIPGGAIVAPETAPLRSLYLEQAAEEDGSALFEARYRYRARGVFFDLDPAIEQSLHLDDSMQKWLGEAPHIVFSEEMRALARSIGQGEIQPSRLARKFYNWISENVRYSYAPEYSTIGNLGEACRRDGRGDCGQAAFLFMTLCRLSGIPARWQSGWSIFPGAETIHDWCEIYLSPWGWVPVDPYMGIYATQYATALTPEQRRDLRDFYLGGLSARRLAVNSEHNQPLTPEKGSIRSDPVDFQRGELESGGENLYFDKWSYTLDWEEVHEN
jgi:transglutaminase-like putative cysteine protease